jgi:hypothetical protein
VLGGALSSDWVELLSSSTSEPLDVSTNTPNVGLVRSPKRARASGDRSCNVPDSVLWDAVGAEGGDAYIWRVSLLPEVINAADIRLEMLRGAAAKDLVEAITRSLPELARWFPWAQTPPDLAEQQARLR